MLHPNERTRVRTHPNTNEQTEQTEHPCSFVRLFGVKEIKEFKEIKDKKITKFPKLLKLPKFSVLRSRTASANHTDRCRSQSDDVVMLL